MSATTPAKAAIRTDIEQLPRRAAEAIRPASTTREVVHVDVGAGPR